MKAANRLQESPASSESHISVGEDIMYGNELIKNEETFSHTETDVQPDKTLLDFLLEEDELNSVYIYVCYRCNIRKI